MPQDPSPSVRRWTRFVSRSVHELRTPLSTIALAAELLKRETGGRLETRAAQKLARIEQAVADLLGLLAEISELAKLEGAARPVAAEAVCARDLARDLDTAFRPLAGRKQLGFEIACAPELPPIAGERRRIERLVGLLLESAIAVTDDGEVTVSFGRGADAAAVEIAVSDSGAPVPEADRETLFEPFGCVSPRARRRYGGQGLRLALAAALARHLGGRIEVAGGVPTTVIVRLPSAAAAGDPEPAGRSSTDPWC